MNDIDGRPAPLHRNRDFRRLWIGQACSELGTGAATIAYPLLVLALTGSPVQAGLVGTANLAARAALTLPAGALADRWDRRRIMIAAEALRLTAVAVLTVAILTGWAAFPLIVAVAAVDGVGAAFFGPAQAAALRRIVPTVQLPTAAARNEARQYAAELAGPPLGGALFSVARFAPFLADAVSYLASLVAVASIRTPLRPAAEETRERWGSAIISGLRFVVREPFLRAVVSIAPLVNAAFAGVIFVLVVVLQERGASPAVIGTAQSAILVGGLAGAMLAPRLQRRVRTPVLVNVCLWTIAAVVAVAAFLPGTYLVAGVLALGLLLAPAVNAALFGYQIAITPDAMQGRVDSTISLLAMGLQPLAPLAGGLLVATLDGRWAFVGFAAVLALAALIAVLSKGIRHLAPLETLTTESKDPAGAR